MLAFIPIYGVDLINLKSKNKSSLKKLFETLKALM